MAARIRLTKLPAGAGGLALARAAPGGLAGAGALSLPEQIALAGLPAPEPEHRFAPPRRFRFDLSYPALMIAIEREGGTWLAGGGRHNRPAGYAKDAEKYNLAAELGYCVLRFTADMIRSGEAIKTIVRVFNARRQQFAKE